MLEALLKASLCFKLWKCIFAAKEIEFVGFIIPLDEIHMKNDCITTMEE
jgi:hypothetical protein